MPIIHEEEFRAWEACAPEKVRGDHLWKFHAYRVARYLADLAERDAGELRTRRKLSQQAARLVNAVASISTSVADGLAGTAPAERSRFFGTAVAAVTESVRWYRAVQPELDPDLCDLRFDQLAEMRQILLSAQKWLSGKPSCAHVA